VTPQRFEQCLATLGWTHRWLAAYLSSAGKELSRYQVDRMATGKASIPPALAAWIEHRTLFAEKNPFPKNWNPKQNNA
jgi:hypothetical protein